MKEMRKKAVAVLLAGVMTFGLAAASLTGCGSDSSEGRNGKCPSDGVVAGKMISPETAGNGSRRCVATFAEDHPEWNITFVYGVADEASAAGQVSQDPEASADVFMYANDTLTTMTDANALGEVRRKVPGGD